MNTPSPAPNDNTSTARYLSDLQHTALLSRDEERTLALQVQEGNEEARLTMIRANLRLVVAIAKGYRNLGMSLSDLIAEGNIGLMKAVERYCPDRGAKFSTYGAFWIRQAIRKALTNQSRTVRLPSHVMEKLIKLRKIECELTHELGHEPSLRELGKAAELSVPQIEALRENAQASVSLDSPVSGHEESSSGGQEWSELIEDEHAEVPDAAVAEKDLHAVLPSLLDTLDSRARNIMELRFGLDGENPRTLNQVGREYGLTRERIRQLQDKALRELRRAWLASEAAVYA